MSARLLLVEDEAALALMLADRLTAEGHSAEVAQDGEEGLERAASDAFDLVVLDVMLPKKSGLDVLRDLRQRGVTTPVLMLTARGQVTDRVVGLKLGADDYLVKPFAVAELLARIEALLRRALAGGAREAAPGVFWFGDVRVDLRAAEVERAGGPVELSAKEFQLLRYLVEHPGAALTRDEILNEVWGYDAAPTTRTVDVHVVGLRQKLEPNPRRPRHILTVYGIGYKFSP